MQIYMRFLTVVGALALLSLGACRNIDYSQMPFYDDIMVEPKEKVDGARRMPAQQPVRPWNYDKPPNFEKNWAVPQPTSSLEPQYQDMLPENVLPEPSEKFANAPTKAELSVAGKLGTTKTEMHEVAKADDPYLFYDEPIQLKPFAYDNSPRINEPKVKTAADMATLRNIPGDGGTYFRAQVSYQPKTIRSGYFDKNFYGNSYFKNEY